MSERPNLERLDVRTDEQKFEDALCTVLDHVERDREQTGRGGAGPEERKDDPTQLVAPAMHALARYVRPLLLVVIPLLILASIALVYVEYVNAKSRAVDNWNPGWRPANGKYYNPTTRR